MSEIVYRFHESARLSPELDPQVVGERLASLRQNGHGFTPEAIVDDARPESSPLHLAFTWDDVVAAERQRLAEAGYLIRHVVTIVHDDERDETRQVRAFIPVEMADIEDDLRYVSMEVAMTNPDYRAQVLGRALGEMIAFRRKYQDFEELARIFKAIDAAAKKLEVHV